MLFRSAWLCLSLHGLAPLLKPLDTPTVQRVVVSVTRSRSASGSFLDSAERSRNVKHILLSFGAVQSGIAKFHGEATHFGRTQRVGENHSALESQVGEEVEEYRSSTFAVDQAVEGVVKVVDI